MKRIGLIGGMSWHSSLLYYQYMNEAVNRRLGNQHSANLALISVDFESILYHWNRGDRDQVLKILASAVKDLEKIKVDFFLICSNTAHQFADQLTQLTALPMLHIGETVSHELSRHRYNSVGLLGTQATINSDIYSRYLSDHNINLVVPEPSEQLLLDHLIFSELARGIFQGETLNLIQKMMHNLKNKGAESIILGCTELPLLFQQHQTTLPLMDSVYLHALNAVNKALSK